MAITTMAGLQAASIQKIQYTKNIPYTTVPGAWFTTALMAGSPLAQTIGSAQPVSASAIILTDSSTNYPVINNFASGASGYISKIDYNCSVPCRMALFDRVVFSGYYSNVAANYTVATNPASSAILARALDFGNLEFWYEQLTSTGTPPVLSCNYTNEKGVGSKTTSLSGSAAYIIGRSIQLPLAAGDKGITAINAVNIPQDDTGAFNLAFQRRLWSGRVFIPGGQSESVDFMKTGLIPIADSAALMLFVAPDSTSSGIIDMQITIASG